MFLFRLSLIGLLFLAFACAQVSASGHGRIVQRQRIVQRRQVQRVQVVQQVQAYPVVQQQVVQKVYSQPVVVQQKRVYAQPVIQQQNYCAPQTFQQFSAPGCQSFFAP